MRDGEGPRQAALVVIVAVAVLLVALEACGGVAPPSPSSSFQPAVVGVASRVEALPCGLSRVTLVSGDHVDLVMTGSSLNDATPCPSSTVEPSRLLFGPNAAQVAKDHLFLAGRDAGGKHWYAWAAQRSDDGPSCDPGTYVIAGGAFEDGGSFHLPSGLLLATSPAFDRGTSGSPSASSPPMIVESDGWICVAPDGGVVSAGGPGRL